MNPWVWPPPPLEAQPFAPVFPGGTIFARVANPASAVILKAPPSGYINLAVFATHNADAVNTLTFRVHDADGDQCGNGAAPLVANSDAFPVPATLPLIVTTDLTAVVAGGTGGTPAEFRGNYTQVPAPIMLRSTIALTTAYQAIPVVPASGQVMGIRFVSVSEGSNLGLVIFNGDTANCTPQFRLTRGATVFTWNASLVTVGVRSFPSPVPPLLTGDLLEVKLSGAPVIAGSILLRAIFVPVAVSP